MRTKIKTILIFSISILIALTLSLVYQMGDTNNSVLAEHCAPGHTHREGVDNPDDFSCEPIEEGDQSANQNVNCPEGQVPVNSDGEPSPNGNSCGDPNQSSADENLQGTRCDYDGDGDGQDGFVTSNPFGEENVNYKKIGEDKYCMQRQQGNNPESNPIFVLINDIIKFLSAGIFIVGVLMITVAGIQYITAGGNPEATKAARDRIGQVVLGLVLYFFFFAIMQFLVPGGIFN